MKLLLSRLTSSCISPISGDQYFSGELSPSKTPPTTTTTTLDTTLSLETLPSIPSISDNLLSSTTVTLTLITTPPTTLNLPSSVTSLTISPHDNLLYASSSHHTISIYHPSSLSLLHSFTPTPSSSSSLKSLSFTPTHILSSHQDGKIRIWKQTNKKDKNKNNIILLNTLPTVTDRLLRFPLPKNHIHVRRHKKRLWVEHHDAVSSLAFNPSSGLLYSVSWDKTLKVWNPKSGFKCLESITAHEDAVNALQVSPDGIVYTGSADGRIRVWAKSDSDKKHSRIATLEKHKSGVNALALSVDGSILFSGACDRSILVWEREDSGKYMVVSGALRGHQGAILCLINVSDFLISGSADRTVRIWRRGFDGKFCCLMVLEGHLKAVKSLAAQIEPEINNGIISVFSGGLDGEIKVWRIKIDYNNNNQHTDDDDDTKTCRL